MITPSHEKLVGALVNGLAVLRFLQRSRGGVGVTHVARELNLNPSNCFNILRTLVHENLANFDPNTKTYTLSMGVVSLAQGALDRQNHIRVLHPVLERLAVTHGVAMNLWQVIGNDRVLLVDRAEPNTTVQISMRIGQRLPLLAGALGRCLAVQSGMTRDETEERFNRIKFATPINFDDWYSQLEQVRRDGYALDQGNFSRGVTTASVGIASPEGKPFLAVSAIAVSAQIDDARLEDLVQDLLALKRTSALDGSSAAFHL